LLGSDADQPPVSEPLFIALVSPHPVPARDDVAQHVAAQAEALARRGHGVTLLAPGTGRERLAEGRARLARLGGGDPGGLVAEPGEVLVVAVGRALPAGAGRRLGGPFDLAANLELALERAPFDVVHLHEPLAPSPALSQLRRAQGVTAATFHRTEQLAGVAFLRPLVDRALGRVDLQAAATETARRALADVLPGEYLLIPAGIDPERFAPPTREPPGPPGLVAVARGRDRAGMRFALHVLRGLDLAAVGPVTLLGPGEAPWRTRAAVPKALRPAITALPDLGPDARAEALGRGRIALLATPEDVAGPVLREAMACGMAVLAPRSAELDGVVAHGRDGLALPPFSRDAWIRAAADLAARPGRRAELGARAAARAHLRTWDRVAEELEGHYRSALAERRARPAGRRTAERILADLRLRPTPGVDAAAIVAACLERGIDAVAVAAPRGLEPALDVAAAAPEDLIVVVGQEIATRSGTVVGLFLAEPVPDDLELGEALARVRAQGGVVLVPHPMVASAPPPEELRRHAAEIDCYEALSSAPLALAGGEEAALLAGRLGLLVTAGSAAAGADGVGLAATRMGAFRGPAEFLAALSGAELVRRRRGLRAQRARGRRRPPRSPSS
jgi:glycosyltransferase involved in cell wall biosynthesis